MPQHRPLALSAVAGVVLVCGLCLVVSDVLAKLWSVGVLGAPCLLVCLGPHVNSSMCLRVDSFPVVLPL